jgi:hypothetical protein
MLRGLCLEFFTCAKVWHIYDVHVHIAALPNTHFENSNCFEEMQAFNIAHSTADFNDHHVIAVTDFQHFFDNCIGHVRYYLHCFSTITACSFFVDHTLIYASSHERTVS